MATNMLLKKTYICTKFTRIQGNLKARSMIHLYYTYYYRNVPLSKPC